jgi:hypothetical protein
VLFRTLTTGVVVDVHDEFDSPDLFDLWRLRTYFGSLGKQGVQCIVEATGISGQSIDVGLQSALSTLECEGKIERVGQHFRLVPLP